LPPVGVGPPVKRHKTSQLCGGRAGWSIARMFGEGLNRGARGFTAMRAHLSSLSEGALSLRTCSNIKHVSMCEMSRG
jgi:hypothetical protein